MEEKVFITQIGICYYVENYEYTVEETGILSDDIKRIAPTLYNAMYDEYKKDRKSLSFLLRYLENKIQYNTFKAAVESLIYLEICYRVNKGTHNESIS